MNQVSLLKDNLGSTFNTIGRYYQKHHKAYRSLFDLLWEELNSVYEYLRQAINIIFKNYEEIDHALLRVFISSVEEIELMADQVEDFLMNKYFSRTKVQHRLYFQAEELSKV